MRLSSRPGTLALVLILALGLVWMTLLAAVRASAAPSPSSIRKVIAPPGVFDDKTDGVTLLHDYGAFALYAVETARSASLSPQAQQMLRQADTMDLIQIDAYPFNGRTDTPNLPDHLRVDAVSGSALQLIQFVGPIKEAWLQAIRNAGGIPIHYIANNAYLVWTDGSGRSRLDGLVQDGRILQYSAPYQPYFKLGPKLRPKVTAVADPTEVVTVHLQMLRHPGQGATEAAIRARRLGQLSPWSPVLSYQNTIVTLRLGDIVALAHRPDVVWLELYSEPVLLDEVQAQIVAGNLDGTQSGPSAPGYLTWLNSFGFSQDPDAYPIVDISDDGVGDGTLSSGDPTLHRLGVISGTTSSRLQYVTNCTAAPDGGGVGGHGHINASIVAGYDERVGVPYQDGNNYQRGLGLNPYTRLGSTRLFAGGEFDLSGCTDSLSFIIEQIYANGARISSNSWGCDTCAGTYDTFSQLYDARTRDADVFQEGNQALTFVFGAGNNGPIADTIFTPGNGKNLTAVGGSENNRAYNLPFGDGCFISDDMADNAMDIIFFSSRGPAPGGRVKPEIVAPATHIQGTASTHPDYDGTTVCNQYQPNNQAIFASSSGTSHATPAVSGVMSLYRYWLQNTHGIADPSPALMKAYLLAHPTYLTGADANDTLPSNVQGYGMPNLGIAFDAVPRFIADQATTFDNTGETKAYTVSVASASDPLRVVMAYTDQAGAVGTNPLVNDLSLQANVSGTTYFGNQFSGQWSVAGGTRDSANNYEAVFLPAGVTGTVVITVTAYNIAGDGVPNTGDSTDQDFALICYNCRPADDFAIEVSPEDKSICMGDDAGYTVDVDPLGAFSGPVTLSLSGQPPGTAFSMLPGAGTPPFTSALTLSNTAGSIAGDYKLTVSGSGSTGTRSDTAWLHLQDTPPSAITLIDPADGAIDISLTPTFTWTAPILADSYQLELATDAAMTNVVYRAVVVGNSHTVDGQLHLDTLYYWRVRAINACGSAVSAVFSFRTIPAPPPPPPPAPYLLVDDDWGTLGEAFPPFRDVRGVYTNALTSLGIPYDIYDREANYTDPDTAMLAQYDAVIWFTGDAGFWLIGTLAGPDAAGESQIAPYLDGGGCFLISSMEYFSSRTLTPFMADYLGLASGGDITYTLAAGVGPMLGGLGPYALSPSGRTTDQLTPDTTAVVEASDGGALDVGISKDGGIYRSSFLGFDLANINDANGARDILDAFITWCNNRPALTIDDPVADEPDGTITFTVSLTPTTSAFDVTVRYTTTNGTAFAGSDYVAATGVLTFPAGTLVDTIAVTLLDDGESEADESFAVNLGSATNISIADGSGEGTIVDDESVPTAVTLREIGVADQDESLRSAIIALLTISLVLTWRIRREQRPPSGKAAGEPRRF